jgi:predicted transposase YbfD/YdcC
MLPRACSLLEAFACVPDPRSPLGRRYSLPSILALATAATLCGYRSYSAIAEWGRNYGSALASALGFGQGKTPCAATLNGVFRRLEHPRVEQALTSWAEGVLAASPPPSGATDTLALDGKTLRGSRRQGGLDTHLLSALSHHLGLTLHQQAIEDKTNEITAATEVLSALILEGRVVTMDAMFTQRTLAQQITDAGGHYVMIVKGNQPSLLQDIAVTFERAHWLLGTQPKASHVDVGHGRIETRRIRTSTVMAGYSSWPGLEQVFRLEREVRDKRTNTRRYTEVVFGVTSLQKEQAGAAALLTLVRRHWSIENGSHWVRDVTFDEDRSQVRVGAIPQVMAALRNTAIGLMRAAGETNIAAACRRFAAQPWSALALLGIYPRTE